MSTSGIFRDYRGYPESTVNHGGMQFPRVLHTDTNMLYIHLLLPLSSSSSPWRYQDRSYVLLCTRDRRSKFRRFFPSFGVFKGKPALTRSHFLDLFGPILGWPPPPFSTRAPLVKEELIYNQTRTYFKTNKNLFGSPVQADGREKGGPKRGAFWAL